VCFAGLDLSASRDLTAFVMVFPRKDGSYDIKAQFFLPAKGIREKSRIDKVPWDQWADQGYLTLIDGPVIVPSVVAQHVAGAHRDYRIESLAYDRWRINDFKRELDAIGADVPMAEFGQGFRDMSPAVDRLERLVAERKIRHGDNPILNMCAANAVVQADPAGNRKLHKPKSSGKIDGIIALCMALGSESKNADTQIVSAWEDESFSLSTVL
jgi:Phage terminase-like protein, large subunit